MVTDLTYQIGTCLSRLVLLSLAISRLWNQSGTFPITSYTTKYYAALLPRLKPQFKLTLGSTTSKFNSGWHTCPLTEVTAKKKALVLAINGSIGSKHG